VAEVELRFYGRFVLARPKNAKKITFLAPNMTFKNSGKRRFGRHHVSLCIPRSAVSPTRSTLPPTTRIMSDRDAQFAECFVWDLAGCSLTVPRSGAFSFTSADKVPDLEELEAIQGRTAKLDPASRKPSRKGRTSAAIEVASGKGRARAAFRNLSDYITRKDAEDGDPDNDTPIGNPEKHADVFEFTITVPDTPGTLRLRVKKGSRPTKYVTIDTTEFKKQNPKGAVLRASVTSLCPTLPTENLYDTEFGQYYELLTKPKDDRLIPRPIPSAGIGGDCNESAQISY
jgi:hypothetical protein